QVGAGRFLLRPVKNRKSATGTEGFSRVPRPQLPGVVTAASFMTGRRLIAGMCKTAVLELQCGRNEAARTSVRPLRPDAGRCGGGPGGRAELPLRRKDLAGSARKLPLALHHYD